MTDEDKQVAVALLCFPDEKGTAKARKPLEAELRSTGDARAADDDPPGERRAQGVGARPSPGARGDLDGGADLGSLRVGRGTDKVESAIVWAVLGALCGGAYAYASEHLLTKSELARLGRRLAAGSSALVTYALASDPERVLAAAGAYGPSAAGVATIDADPGARVFAGTAGRWRSSSTSTPR